MPVLQYLLNLRQDKALLFGMDNLHFFGVGTVPHASLFAVLPKKITPTPKHMKQKASTPIANKIVVISISRAHAPNLQYEYQQLKRV